MNEEPYLPPRENGNGPSGGASSCLWITWIWFGPSIVVPLILIVTAGAIPLAILLALGFLIFMGMASAGRNGEEGKAPLEVWRVILYVLLQIIWIPLFTFAVLWGICAMNGGMKF